MEEVIYLKKKEQNQQLLILFKKLQDLEESCWTKLLRFQKSQYFIQFQKKYSVPNIITIRLDDLIYLLLLVILEVIFGLLPIDSSSYLTTPYRQSLALFFLTTFIVTISPHWFRWLTLIIFCLGYPILLFLTFNGIITLMPVDSSTSMFSYLGYLTLIPIFILLLLIYPIKEYIRNILGSIYSYIFALSLTVILYLWPLYSFIQSGSFSFSFVTSNQPLMIAFMTVVITGFYFFIHHTLFQIKIQTIKKILLEDFTQGQLTQALEQIEEDYQEKTTCIHQNFTVFVRSMSLIIYFIVLGTEIYLFLKLADNTSKINTIGPIMGYVIAFLLLGAFFIFIPVSKQVFIPLISIISIGSALPSLIFYNTTTTFTDYAIVSLSFPFFAIFWSLVKLISIKRPIFRTNLLIGFYIIIYLPVMALVINIYQIFTSDSSLISTLNYLFYSTIIISLLILFVVFIVWQVSKKKKQEPKQQQKQRIAVDYNYFQQGNPSYQHYQINKLNVTYISNVDLRDTGYILCLLFFIVSQLMAVHSVNQLNTTFASTTFYSSSIRQVIYSQFYTVLISYIYSHVFLATTGSTVKYFFLPYFILTAILFLFAGFALGVGSTTLKIMGGFSLIMVLIVIAFQALKSFAQNMLGFILPIMIIVLWTFIIFPYVVLIPFISIYVDQTKFGTFVYGCILATIVLLILLVGVLTFLFNKLIDKYEEQKKYKFMTEDVQTLFEEEGVEAQDETLHILYESFLHRDKKYVFFLKRGFPLNLLKDPNDEITKLVTSQDYKLKRIPTKKVIDTDKQRKESCLWMCLTCFCGEDEQQINQKLKKAKKKIDKQELQSLLPRSLMAGLIKPNELNNRPKKQPKKNLINPSKIFSSKSLILKDLHNGPRYLGDEYILLKTNKKADLAIEIWHNIFQFAANTDQIEPLIISNDFSLLLQAAGVTQISKINIDQIFHRFAKKKWKGYSGMDLQNFALAIQSICEKVYDSSQLQIPNQQRKYYFLIDKIYYNLSSYQQFNNFNFQKKRAKTSIKNSPFKTSYKRYKQFLQQDNKQKVELIDRIKANNRNKLLQQFNQEQFRVSEVHKEEVEEQKKKSCKRAIFQKVRSCQTCCKKQENKEQIQKKLFVKPWNLLSVDAVKILQHKQIEWSSQAKTKQLPFRITSNNILMAAFKLIDIYSYISISLFNPQIKWISSSSSSTSFLYTDYSVQTFIAGAVVAISVPLGIKGIMLIFQDRLGLTENRLPAAFPHPMFFFTFIYKLMILSLFNAITQTFLDTFNCNWTSSSTTTYVLNDDTSIECFSDVHNRFILISLIGILVYYPLSSYAMPNFQFAEKSLDLKYRSSYLILYFQVNFALLSGKVLLSTSSTVIIQVIYNSINIFALSLLAFSAITIQPCLITWFNYVQFTVIGLGLIVNVVGLALYITELWLLCVITASGGCLLLIIFIIIFIRRKYFKAQIHSAELEGDQNVQQLQMMWQAKLKKDKKIIEFQNKNKAGLRLQPIGNDDDNSSEDKTLQK